MCPSRSCAARRLPPITVHLVPRGSSIVSFEDEHRDELLELAHHVVDLPATLTRSSGRRVGFRFRGMSCSLRLITFERTTRADSELHDSRRRLDPSRDVARTAKSILREPPVTNPFQTVTEGVVTDAWRRSRTSTKTLSVDGQQTDVASSGHEAPIRSRESREEPAMTIPVETADYHGSLWDIGAVATRLGVRIRHVRRW